MDNGQIERQRDNRIDDNPFPRWWWWWWWWLFLLESGFWYINDDDEKGWMDDGMIVLQREVTKEWKFILC